MSTINLIIGGVDISENVETESYSVKKVWKTNAEFTDVNGEDIIRRSGFFYELSVELHLVPDTLMRSLTAALDSDSISVTFTDPHSEDCTTASFLRGDSTGGKISQELDDGLLWDMSISLTSEFVQSGGGL